MSNLLQFVGGQRRITQINGSTQAEGLVASSLGCDVKSFYSTLTGGQWQTVLNIAGAGALNVAAAVSQGSSTIGLRVTLDGIVVVSRSMALSTVQSLIGVGFPNTIFNGTNAEVIGVAPKASPFRSSCLVEVSTSVVANGALAGRTYLAWDTYE